MLPTTKEEFDIRFAANAYADPDGSMECAFHIPCPFCAAPDFVVAKLLEFNMITSMARTCRECDRGVKLVLKPVHHPKTGNLIGESYQFLQTHGEDPPSWAPMKRVEIQPGAN
jgi:hypothetical protein